MDIHDLSVHKLMGLSIVKSRHQTFVVKIKYFMFFNIFLVENNLKYLTVV